jgi:hypothetical protein
MTTNPVNIAPAIQPETSVFAECTQKIRDLIAKIQEVIMGILETILPCIFGKTVVEPPKNTISTGENLPQAQAVQKVQQAVLPQAPAPQPVAPAPAPVARPAPAAQPAAPVVQPRPPAAQPAPAPQPAVAQPAQQPVVPVEVPAAQPAALNPEPALPPVQQDVQPEVVANVPPPANPVEQPEEVPVLNIAPLGAAAQEPVADAQPLGVRAAAARFAGGPAPQLPKTPVVGKFGQAAGASPMKARPSTPAPGPQPAPAPKQAIPPAQLQPVEADESGDDDFEQLDIPNPGTLKVPLTVKRQEENQIVLPPKPKAQPQHPKSEQSVEIDKMMQDWRELGVNIDGDQLESLVGDPAAQHLMQVAAERGQKRRSFGGNEKLPTFNTLQKGFDLLSHTVPPLLDAPETSVFAQVIEAVAGPELPKGTVVSGEKFSSPGNEPLLVLDPERILEQLDNKKNIVNTDLDILVTKARRNLSGWQELAKQDYKSVIISALEQDFQIVGNKELKKNKPFSLESIQKMLRGLMPLKAQQQSSVIGAVFCRGTIQNPKVYEIFSTGGRDFYLLNPYGTGGSVSWSKFDNAERLAAYLAQMDAGSAAQAEEICWVTPFISKRKATTVDLSEEKRI